MPKFSDRLKQLRTEYGFSQQTLADKLGCISKSSINMYERGEREPGLELLEAIADLFNVDMDFLLGKSDIQNRSKTDNLLPNNIIPMPEMYKIPLVGSIACGAPILAEEHIEEYIDIPKHIRADFALTCKGDSMINDRIYDGDVVYIHQQDQVENGEVAAVLIDNDAKDDRNDTC